jgi:hypothetical protein
MRETGTGQQAAQIHDRHMIMVIMVMMVMMIMMMVMKIKVSTLYQFKKFPSK